MITISMLFLSSQEENAWAKMIAYDYVYVRNTHVTTEAEQLIWYNAIVAAFFDGSYYENTFGPSGQNKTQADFFHFFRITGNTTSQASGKTGATPRWQIDGTVYNQVNLPAHVKGAGAGYVFLSTTDGFGGWGSFNINSNPFTGSMPKMTLTGVSNFVFSFCNFSGTLPQHTCANVASFAMSTNNFTGQFPSISMNNVSYFDISSNKFSGNMPNISQLFADYQLLNINDFTSCDLVPSRYANQFNLNRNDMPTTAIDSFLTNFRVARQATPPVSNLTLLLNGTGMGAPTGGLSNVELATLSAIYTSAGKIFTYFINT